MGIGLHRHVRSMFTFLYMQAVKLTLKAQDVPCALTTCHEMFQLITDMNIECAILMLIQKWIVYSFPNPAYAP